MRICPNCNTQLKDDDLFCKKCGQKIEQRLSHEDSLYLAADLEKKYAERELTKNELSELEREILKYTLPSRRRRYSTFRFFWPFLIISQIAVFVVGMGLVVVLIATGNLEISEDALKALLYLLAFITEGVTIIIGAIVAANKRNRLNAKLEAEELVIMGKQRSINDRIAELRTLLRTQDYAVKEYEGRVPPILRNERGMRRVRELLEYGKAEDFDQAIHMV
jgi:hypothetical protein